MDDTQPSLSRYKSRNELRDLGCLLLLIMGIGLVCFLIWMALLAYALGGLGSALNSPLCDPQTPKDIEEMAQIKLP